MPYKDIEVRRNFQREWRKNHPEEVLLRKPYFTSYNRKYLTRLKNRERVHFDQVITLMHYSNPKGIPVCNRCGEQDIELLCVDHIIGGGVKHEKERKSPLYRWLIKNNYPEGYQVLCANCNQRKMRMDRSRNGN